jgi:6-phosphogluconolactonase (cycloisomerase 2 family)
LTSLLAAIDTLDAAIIAKKGPRPMPRTMSAHRPVLLAFVCAILAGCGGGGGGGGGGTPPPPPPPAQSFSVGGTVSGLDAGGLVLQNNGGPDLAISANGAFTFPAQVASGSAYAVTVKTQPSIGALQLCSVTNGSGTMPNSAVTNVTIACALRTFKFLYTTSTFTDDLRGYSIDATSGALTALPGPPAQPGIDPVVPTANPSGRFLYVTTRGDQSVPPKLAVYSVDNATGALTELLDSPYDLSAPPPAPGPSFVVPPTIHPSGTFGYLPLFYSTTLLYGATINATTGQLTQIPGTPIDLGNGLAGMLYDSTGDLLVMVINPSTGNSTIRTFRVNTPSGVLTPIGTFPVGATSTGAFFAPGESYLLGTHLLAGTLTVFAVNKTAGTLAQVNMTPIPTGPPGSAPLALVFNRRNNVFYVTHIRLGGTSTAPTVAAFALDANGGVTPIGAPVPSNGSNGFAVLHPSGRFLFQFNGSTGSVQRYALDATTGAPALLPDSTALPGAPQTAGMFLDPSGKFVYVTNPVTSTVSSYSIDATTGALTLINSAPTSPGGGATSPFGFQ